MRSVLVLLAATVGLGFVFGWALAPGPEQLASRPREAAFARPADPRDNLLVLADVIETSPRNVVVNEVEAPAPAEPAAPPFDVTRSIRSEVTAVFGGARPSVVLVDPDRPTQRRVLRAGAHYREGWRLAAVSPQRLLLRRGDQKREVFLFEPAGEVRILHAAEWTAPVAPSVAPARMKIERPNRGDLSRSD